MTIERNPHPWFSLYWTLWVLSTIAIFITGPVAKEIWALWFTAFMLVEIVGVLWQSAEDHRDTLSETMTWVQRHLSKHRMFFRGWNAAIFVLVLIISWVSVSLVEEKTAQIVIGTAIGVWLYDHWMSPDIHG